MKKNYPRKHKVFNTIIADIKTPYFAIFWLALIFVSYSFIDQKLALQVHNLQIPLFDHIAEIFSQAGKGGYFLLGSVLVFIYARFWKNKPKLALAALFVLLAVLISGILCDALKCLMSRARPMMWFDEHLYGFYFLQFKSSMWSFPSGHSTTISAAMVALSILIPRYWLGFFTILVLVGFSRIVLEAHYLSDVLAGMYLGTMSSIILFKYLSKIQDFAFLKSPKTPSLKLEI